MTKKIKSLPALRKKMKDIQRNLLFGDAAHSGGACNALLAPDQKLPDLSVGNSMDDSRRFKPYVVTIEVEARSLEEAKAIAFILASGDGGGNANGTAVSVVQKYRMTNFNTEWHSEGKC